MEGVKLMNDNKTKYVPVWYVILPFAITFILIVVLYCIFGTIGITWGLFISAFITAIFYLNIDKVAKPKPPIED